VNVILLVTFPTFLMTDSSRKDSSATLKGVDERSFAAKNFPVMARYTGSLRELVLSLRPAKKV